jgi:hypothetical protein
MPRGTCKLCLQVEELRKSHLIPAAMYKYIRAPSGGNPNPVVLGRRITATTSRHVADYLLCAGCEDMFNKNGEKEVLKWVWNGKRFPLGDRLAVAHPYFTLRSFLAFSGAAIGVDTAKFAYFALSVVWRAGVHQWATPFGGKISVLKLGQVQEPIRQYLHGDADLPPNVAILMTACTDRASIGCFYLPSRSQNFPGSAFGMLTLGIHFTVCVGDDIPPSVRQVCCVRSGPRLIFLRDCQQKTVDAFAQVVKTSRPARGVR